MSTIANTDTKEIVKNDYYKQLEIQILKAVRPFVADEKTAREVHSGFLYCLRKNKAIKNCDPASVILALSECAQLDLIPGARQECALVPYKNDLTFQPMVKGLIKIMYRAGVKSVDSEVVCQNDFFEYEQGSTVKLTFKKNLFEDRGKEVAAYAVITQADGSQIIEVMTIKQLTSIRNRAKNSFIWNEHPEEMYRKTVIKRAYKRCISDNTKLIELIEKDNSLERPDCSAQIEELNEKLESVQPTGVITADQLEDLTTEENE